MFIVMVICEAQLRSSEMFLTTFDQRENPFVRGAVLICANEYVLLAERRNTWFRFSINMPFFQRGRYDCFGFRFIIHPQSPARS